MITRTGNATYMEWSLDKHVCVKITGPNHHAVGQQIINSQNALLIAARYMVDQAERGELEYQDEFDDLVTVCKAVDAMGAWPENWSRDLLEPGGGRPRDE